MMVFGVGRPGKGSATATDNAGPADDTRGNTIQERTQQYIHRQDGDPADNPVLTMRGNPTNCRFSMLFTATVGYCQTGRDPLPE